MKTSKREKPISDVIKRVDGFANLQARSDATYSVPSELWTYTREHEFNFIPDLLHYRYEDVNSHWNLLKTATDDPLAKFIIIDVTKQAFDDGFHFEDDEGNKVNNLRVRKFFQDYEEIQAHPHFIDFTIKSEIHGWSLFALSKKGIATYSPLQARVTEIDDRGFPTDYTIQTKIIGGVKSGYSSWSEYNEFPLKSKEVIHGVSHISFNFSPKMEGISSLLPIFADLVLLRWLKYAMTEIGCRVGGGFYWIKTNAASKERLDAINTAMRGVNNRRHVTTGTEIEEIRQVLNDSLNLNYVGHSDKLLEAISEGSGLSTVLLKGAQAGTVAGSEVNERSLYRKIRILQTHYVKYVIQLIDWMGYEDLTEKYKVKWNWEPDTSEAEEVSVQLAKIQIAETMSRMKSFLPDEVRAVVGYEPLKEEEQEKVLENKTNIGEFDVNFKEEMLEEEMESE